MNRETVHVIEKLMPDDRLKLSVIIPTHNRAQLLFRALKSVWNQTVPADEVIIVDDGSTDNTAEFVHDHFPQFRIIAQQQKGVSAARNLGVSNAKNQWIAFLDSDDEWLPNKLAIQMEALNNQPHYLLSHTEEIWIRNGRRVNPMKKHKKHGGYIFNKCLPLCVMSPSSVIIHQDLIHKVGLFDESLPACEDYDLWLRICANHPVLFIDVPLIKKYGGHDDQLSRRYWGMDRFRIRSLEKIIQSGELPEESFRAAVNMLLKKIDIYIQGARKRGRDGEVLHYELKRENYTQNMTRLGEGNGEKRFKIN